MVTMRDTRVFCRRLTEGALEADVVLWVIWVFANFADIKFDIKHIFVCKTLYWCRFRSKDFGFLMQLTRYRWKYNGSCLGDSTAVHTNRRTQHVLQWDCGETYGSWQFVHGCSLAGKTMLACNYIVIKSAFVLMLGPAMGACKDIRLSLTCQSWHLI